MANDIAPALLEKLQKAFAEKFNQNKKIQELYQIIREGRATYAEVNELSIEVGNILAEVFQENLSSSILRMGECIITLQSGQ